MLRVGSVVGRVEVRQMYESLEGAPYRITNSVD